MHDTIDSQGQLAVMLASELVLLPTSCGGITGSSGADLEGGSFTRMCYKPHPV